MGLEPDAFFFEGSSGLGVWELLVRGSRCYDGDVVVLGILTRELNWIGWPGWSKCEDFSDSGFLGQAEIREWVSTK
jgi:hypothetical protein